MNRALIAVGLILACATTASVGASSWRWPGPVWIWTGW